MKLKESAYKACLVFIEGKISTAETALRQAREASNDDTKSSAGDKFETTREMMQQDIERNEALLVDAQRNLFLLQSLQNVETSSVIKNGSLVETDQGMFFISISAGQLNLDKELCNSSVFAISAASPIGKLMVGKAAGDEVSFNNKSYKIKTVY